MGCDVPMLALAWTGHGRTVEKAAVRWSRVFMRVVPAWLIDDRDAFPSRWGGLLERCFRLGLDTVIHSLYALIA
jgi:hypothetical protein